MLMSFDRGPRRWSSGEPIALVEAVGGSAALGFRSFGAFEAAELFRRKRVFETRCGERLLISLSKNRNELGVRMAIKRDGSW